LGVHLILSLKSMVKMWSNKANIEIKFRIGIALLLLQELEEC